jgi:photosynthetic reaction center cytochrome c subunit
MWLSQRNFRKVAVLVSIGAAMGTVGAAIVGIWLVYELSSGAERRGMAIEAAAPYSNAQNLQRITEAQPNTPTDGRSSWLGQQDWTQGVQAGQEYVTQFPEPQNVQVLTSMNTSEIWAYMQQQVSGALSVGCQYCHNVEPGPDGLYVFDEDTFPQKIAARDMMRLVNDLNAKFIVNLPYWRGNYVTCATCHSGLGNGAGTPENLEGVSDQFLRGTPPIKMMYNPLDENGEPIRIAEQKPPELRELRPLKELTLWNLYNYQVWNPYDPADPKSGRGTLALVNPEASRTQDQVNITQGTMNLMAWSIGVGCTYCHNARNFYHYEITTESELMDWEASEFDGEHIAPRIKAERMLLMTTYIAENWDTYGAIPTETPREQLEGRLHFREINGEYYNMPGCYTCHARNNIPKAVIHQDDLTNTNLPVDLRGTQ